MFLSSRAENHVYLLQGNNIRDHCAVQDELHPSVWVGLDGVHPGGGEKKGLVTQVYSPMGEDYLPAWGEVLAFCQHMAEGTRIGL